MENCETSAIGRAISNSVLVLTKPNNNRPSREEMEKVVRNETVKTKPNPELEALAITAMSQVGDIVDMNELKNFYTGAQQAGILTIEMDGTSVNAMIARRKKELENN
jgi:threonine aldolase